MSLELVRCSLDVALFTCASRTRRQSHVNKQLTHRWHSTPGGRNAFDCCQHCQALASTCSKLL